MKQKNLIPIILIAGGAVLIFTAIAFIIWPSNSNSGQESNSELVYVEGAHPEVPRVSLDDAKLAYDQGGAVFVDVRGTEAFQTSHIPGAMDIPGQEIGMRIDELSSSAWIITYCT